MSNYIYHGKRVRNVPFFSLKHGDVCTRTTFLVWRKVDDFLIDEETLRKDCRTIFEFNFAKKLLIDYIGNGNIHQCTTSRYIYKNPNSIPKGYPYGYVKIDLSDKCTEKDLFRFRMDAVPGTTNDRSWKTYFGSYYRRPKTTQERRMSFKEKDLVRAKRNHNNLANSWDDKPVNMEKSWKSKSKKRKQWM